MTRADDGDCRIMAAVAEVQHKGACVGGIDTDIQIHTATFTPQLTHHNIHTTTFTPQHTHHNLHTINTTTCSPEHPRTQPWQPLRSHTIPLLTPLHNVPFSSPFIFVTSLGVRFNSNVLHELESTPGALPLLEGLLLPVRSNRTLISLKPNSDLTKSEFFKDFDWTALRDMTMAPPYIPPLPYEMTDEEKEKLRKDAEAAAAAAAAQAGTEPR